MLLTFRPATLSDFEGCYRIMFPFFGAMPEAQKEVEREWNLLVADPSTASLVVEDRMRSLGERIVAYAAAVFVSDSYVEYATSEMPPYTNRYVIAPLPDGSRPILDADGICKANTGPGLNVLITHWDWSEATTSVEEGWYIRHFLNEKFMRFYAGYKLKEIVLEALGEPRRAMAIHAGFRQRTDFCAYFRHHPAPPPDLYPYLMGVSREEAFANEGSLISHAFVYTPPVFFFTPREQALLCLAVKGDTDEQIARTLDRTEATVKKRWQAIYDQVGHVSPDLLPATPSNGVRGAEKRRQLIAYLQNHPEELRPVAAPSRRAA